MAGGGARQEGTAAVRAVRRRDGGGRARAGEGVERRGCLGVWRMTQRGTVGGRGQSEGGGAREERADSIQGHCDEE